MKKQVLPKLIHNQITDLKFSDYLFVDFNNENNQADAIRRFRASKEDYKALAIEQKFPQIQIQFPETWNKFREEILMADYKPGLFVIEKFINEDYETDSSIQKVLDLESFRSLLKIQQLLHHNFDNNFFASLKEFKLEDYIKELKELLIGKNAFYWGFYKGKELKGFIGIEKQCAELYINELIIDEEFRGQGKGKMLMFEAFHFAFQSSVKKMTTTLSVFNHTGLIFYKSLGFKINAAKYYMNLI